MIYENKKFKLVFDAYDKKRGEEISLSEICKEGDTWLFERSSKRGDKITQWLIKHYKVQEIRRLSGLVLWKEPQLIVVPSIDNGMTAVFTGAMRLPKDRHKVDLVIGEANKANTQIDYVVSMAYKRWYDRAVLDALELYELYSDIEGIEENSQVSKIPELTDLDDAEVKVITPFVQSINNTKDPAMLAELGKGLKAQLEAAKVSEKATQVLRGLFTRKQEGLNGKQF